METVFVERKKNLKDKENVSEWQNGFNINFLNFCISNKLLQEINES